MSQLGLFGLVPAPASEPAPPLAPEPAAPSMPPRATRHVIAPDRVTGSMDAEEVELDGWTDAARAMAAREKRSVALYEVSAAGTWNLRGRVDAPAPPPPRR